ncbi:MAG: TIGR03915 family putative DNA repair protein [Clostridiales bacterium]|jgi:probable DNA metabolism protein|nr:TIGR03915 family putative DNA repair protein [Clostridiales bacterium]
MYFTYDGTLFGFLTVVFTAYEQHITPYAITKEGDAQPALFADARYIPGDSPKAERVAVGIGRISETALDSVVLAFYSGQSGRELIIYRFLQKLFEHKSGALTMHADADCSDLLKLAGKVMHEAHMYKGYVRFRETASGVFYAPIEPDNDLLMLEDFRSHFCERYNNQPFIIHDIRHKRMLVYDGAPYVIAAPDKTEITYSDDELLIRRLWRVYHSSISIASRASSKRQTGFLPKKHRRLMPEFFDDSE